MLSIIKDIFWKGQFAFAGLLDRDRYFIGLFVSFLLAQLLLLAFGFWALPLAVLLHSLLARRALGDWLALPAGLINTLVLAAPMALPWLQRLIAKDMAVFIIGALVALLWLVMNGYMLLFRTGLKPGSHPLRQLNSALKDYKQLTGTAYFWRNLLTAAVLAALYGVAFSYYQDQLHRYRMTGVHLGLGMIALLWAGLYLRMLLFRLRNIGIGNALSIGLLAASAVLLAVLWLMAMQLQTLSAYRYEVWLAWLVTLSPLAGILLQLQVGIITLLPQRPGK
ncbi:hypothetical protein [Gallaecimonas mangrovi]|uniref:hypothetical protein n=1 Tax=Gallaecimonas mangrovi TaxID=2291597 RepID=UPI000E200489|nr:hypothetical protein [Gallaecimonas mangrovi]